MGQSFSGVKVRQDEMQKMQQDVMQKIRQDEMQKKQQDEMQKKQQDVMQKKWASKFTNYEGTMESDWMKTIPNWAICNWFYIFFVVNLIVVVLVIGGAAYALVSKRGAKLFTPTNTFFALLQLVVAGTNTLFYFLICDRSLKPAL